ncbi:MAG TPA: hypothetical protein VJB02_05700 [Coxiellaceae bacterium]|nr:hypothetical protein [Coxiellaceae bacterium]
MPTTLPFLKHSKGTRQGQRIRQLREMTCLSRRAYSRKYGIPLGTLQNWEEGRYGLLNEKAMVRLLDCFAKENIECSRQWLESGQGPRPKALFSTSSMALSAEDSFALELRYFHELHPQAVDWRVEDHAMHPALEKGDRVAGIRLFGEDMDQAIGKICITQEVGGLMQVRRVGKGRSASTFDLVTYNAAFKPQKAISLIMVAPVIWIRRIF